jgi:tetratricopeptide (TPR) repeat protein
MAKFDVFVGRKNELARVDEWAQNWGTTHLMGLHGDGGVGKTWLLLETMRRYSQRDDFLVLYLDAAEQPFNPQYVITLLVQHFGSENFPRLLAGLDELSQTYFDPPRVYQVQEQEVLQVGVQELNHQLRQRRLLFLVDTLEAWDYASGASRPSREINAYGRQFSNALFISAGRNVQERMPLYARDFGPQNVTYLELHDFDRVESAEFFDAADPEAAIAPDMRAKLHLLTGGRPVLLSLAVEWLSRQVPLPEMAEASIDDLRALPADEFGALCEDFEFELVGKVRDLKDPLDRAVLDMAHISRRSNARIMSVMLDLSLGEARALQEPLIELSFVRYNPTTGNFTLHDEMKNLINKHAWPYVDPQGEVRRQLAQRVIEGYYEPRIAELAGQAKARLASDKGPIRRATIGGAEWEQWRLEAECLHYRLQVKVQDGIAYFNDRFGEAQRDHHLMRMQFLLGEMEAAGQIGIKDTLEPATLELRWAEALRLAGQVEQATQICQGLLEKQDLSADNRISAHNILGLIAASTDPEQAEKHYRTALKIAQAEKNTREIGALHNNLGQLFQLASRFDQAIGHFQQAIEFSKQADRRALTASATNNLAYVYRLLGDLAQADVLCRVALAQRKQMGLERDLAYSYLTKGEIDRDRGDLESAERYTKLALRSFDKVGEIRGQIGAYSALANIRRHLDQFDEAEAYLDRGIELAGQIRDEPLLADLLNVYGREQRDRAVYLQVTSEDGDPEAIRALFKSAEGYLERSLELADQYGDPWLITRSRFELALAYYYSGSLSDHDLAELLDQVWDAASALGYWLLQGYVQESRGEIAQRQGDFLIAARYYGLAARLMAQGRGREPERFFDRLSNRLLDPHISPASARALAQGILEVIGGAPTDESLQALHMLCEQALDMHAP